MRMLVILAKFAADFLCGGPRNGGRSLGNVPIAEAGQSALRLRGGETFSIARQVLINPRVPIETVNTAT